jgi:uncharacterized protein
MREQEKKPLKGFALLLKKNPEKLKQIASNGGKAAHKAGTAHEWDSKEAREAGTKGGSISRGGRGRLHPGAI